MSRVLFLRSIFALVLNAASAQNLVANGRFREPNPGSHTVPLPWTANPGPFPPAGNWSDFLAVSGNPSNLAYSGPAADANAMFSGGNGANVENRYPGAWPDLLSQSITGLSSAARDGNGYLSLWLDVKPETGSFPEYGPSTLTVLLDGVNYATFTTGDLTGTTSFSVSNGAVIDTGTAGGGLPHLTWSRVHLILPYAGADTAALQFGFTPVDTGDNVLNGSFTIDRVILIPASPVPEPSAALLSLGAAWVLMRHRRRIGAV